LCAGLSGNVCTLLVAKWQKMHNQWSQSRRLIESTLWKEDNFESEHTSVWGSWYNSETKQWGYACCRTLQRCQPCPIEKPKPAMPELEGSDSGIEKTSETDSEEYKTEKSPWNWNNPPTQLLPAPMSEDASRKEKSEWLGHFVSYSLGVWQREQEQGFKKFTSEQRASFKDLASIQTAMAPLMWRLRKGESLDRGEGNWRHGKTKSRETRTSMEGKFVKELGVLDSLHKMATSAVEKDYFEANAVYMKLAFGNKMWNLTHVAHVAACTMKGAREYRRNRDSLNTYDNDPVSQRYMHAFKKLMHFLQSMNPNEDPRKNFVV